MKAYKDFKAERSGGGREVLPAGGYVCNIISAKVDQNDWGEKLILAIDVAEGQYAGFFKKDYEANNREDKKWRGIYRINVPADDGSERDGWTKRTFNNFIACVQESNSGYAWDWDEKKLKGKKLGVLYRNKEWALDDGRTGWTTEAAGSVSVGDIREGNFKMLKDKPLPENQRPKQSTTTNYTSNNSSGFAVVSEEDNEDDLPF